MLEFDYGKGVQTLVIISTVVMVTQQSSCTKLVSTRVKEQYKNHYYTISAIFPSISFLELLLFITLIPHCIIYSNKRSIPSLCPTHSHLCHHCYLSPMFPTVLFIVTTGYCDSALACNCFQIDDSPCGYCLLPVRWPPLLLMFLLTS